MRVRQDGGEKTGGEENFSPRPPSTFVVVWRPTFQDGLQVPNKGGGAGEVLLPRRFAIRPAPEPAPPPEQRQGQRAA